MVQHTVTQSSHTHAPPLAWQPPFALEVLVAGVHPPARERDVGARDVTRPVAEREVAVGPRVDPLRERLVVRLCLRVAAGAGAVGAVGAEGAGAA